jgi:hypothetical protein
MNHHQLWSHPGDPLQLIYWYTDTDILHFKIVEETSGITPRKLKNLTLSDSFSSSQWVWGQSWISRWSSDPRWPTVKMKKVAHSKKTTMFRFGKRKRVSLQRFWPASWFPVNFEWLSLCFFQAILEPYMLKVNEEIFFR